jgi:hypothetical protein
MELRPNPAYRPRGEPWDPRGRATWVWRAVLVVILAWNLLSSRWATAAVVVATWIVAELLMRRQWNRSRPGEGGAS